MRKILFIIFISLSGFSSQAQDQFTLAAIGSQVPEFSFEIRPGEVQKISDYRGKVVQITFFATWCGPCRKELPHISREIYKKYADNKEFFLLVLGREHSWDEVNKFRKEQKFLMPLYPDPGRKIFSLFAGQNIPRNFLIDRNGKIIFASVGFNDQDFGNLKKEIEKQLIH
jgi:thiol-disulfide isomerase/thioredoxin